VHGEDVFPELVRRLEDWFRKHGRRFPWRGTRDPFVILVTEFLLQRTRADVVERAFHSLFSRYKSPEDLASADIGELRELFSGLGLFYRAERLRNIALALVKRYGGQVPRDLESLLLLKGVGVYIASAVLNFGHGIPTPVVDRNVMRLFNRLFGLTSERRVRDLIERLYTLGDHVPLAYAFIDLGAMVCTEPPRCQSCPLDGLCGKYPPRKGEWRMLRKVVLGGRVLLREQPAK